jgi:hypothetical protein
MASILITPKNKAQFKLLSSLLAEMNIDISVLNDEMLEDLGLVQLMKKANRAKKVSREAIMEILETK